MIPVEITAPVPELIPCRDTGRAAPAEPRRRSRSSGSSRTRRSLLRHRRRRILLGFTNRFVWSTHSSFFIFMRREVYYVARIQFALFVYPFQVSEYEQMTDVLPFYARSVSCTYVGCNG